jgi:hypothetical protein
MRRLLITWSDRGVDGPVPSYRNEQPPVVLRLLDHRENKARYARVLLLTIPRARGPAEELSREVRERVSDVEVRVVALDDPSDYRALLEQLSRLAQEIERSYASEQWEIDVLLSAGSAEAQTVWALLVQAGELRARLLQVIPGAFGFDATALAIREVRFDRKHLPEVRAPRAKVPAETTAPPTSPQDGMLAGLADAVRRAESRAIERAIRQYGGNLVRTSRALGIQRNTLKRKLRALGLYPTTAA